jgi:tRNA dimethylallyltransferase
MAQALTINIITGPTASGKSALALSRAVDENGVIINADSMQIYDALPLLTARPSDEEQAIAPHKLYAFLQPQQICSAAQWTHHVKQVLLACLARGQKPFIVGGTGLYLRALMQGFSPIPDIDPAIRQQGQILHAELGNPNFHAYLAERDSEMASRLKPSDTQRLIRAWEVLTATGKSLAYWQSLPPIPTSIDGFGPLDYHMTIFDLPRPLLHERCRRRFINMMQEGALEETKQLMSQIEEGHVPPDAQVTNSLGYHALVSYLKSEIDQEEAIERAQAQTRQYVKRQTTWMRHQFRDNPEKNHISGFTIIESLE